MNTALREQMLTRAEVLVNGLASWTHDHPEADLDEREAVVLEQGRALVGQLTGVRVGTEPLRGHAERVGADLEGRQQARLAHVQAEHAPPASAYDAAPGQLVVEADGVMVRYRDRYLDGTRMESDWHEVKLGLVAGWDADALQAPSYVAARQPAARFARRLSTEAACRGALDLVGWCQAA